MSVLETVAKKWLSDIHWFSRLVVRRPLRAYQLAPARAIVDSVLHRKGLEFAVMFPRQSGKNETQAQVEAYLLNLFQRVPGAAIVKAQPTMRPQGLNALARLQRALGNDWNRGQWTTTHGYQVHLGQAAALFFSASPDANPVGATASLLLECDEAQDVLEAEWQKKFVPMASSTNATIVYWGTAWTSRTLLAKAIRQLREQEAADGVQRVFIVGPDQVAAENPPYGEFIARQVARQGRQHPLIRTQYFNEEIDAEGGMFPPARRALMRGQHPRQPEPQPGKIYALLLDVAGEDEGVSADVTALENPRRDATVLTIVEVDLSTLADPVLAAPTYRCVDRRLWVGVKHATLYGILRATARCFGARYLVADATGVGAGLVGFLAKALPAGVVIPFEFNSSSKSRLGWDFISICEAGRWLEYQEAGGRTQAAEGAQQQTDCSLLTASCSAAFGGVPTESATFWREVEFCQYEVLPGPAHLLRWGVPNGTRDPATGDLVHDDTVLSAALAAVLDAQPWAADTGPGQVLKMPDPLAALEAGY